MAIKLPWRGGNNLLGLKKLWLNQKDPWWEILKNMEGKIIKNPRQTSFPSSPLDPHSLKKSKRQ